MDAIEKSTAKVQEKTELRLAGIEARVADVTTAGSSLGAAVGDQLKASLEQPDEYPQLTGVALQKTSALLYDLMK